jgi:hypothetical protein
MNKENIQTRCLFLKQMLTAGVLIKHVEPMVSRMEFEQEDR